MYTYYRGWRIRRWTTERPYI